MILLYTWTSDDTGTSNNDAMLLRAVRSVLSIARAITHVKHTQGTWNNSATACAKYALIYPIRKIFNFSEVQIITQD